MSGEPKSAVEHPTPFQRKVFWRAVTGTSMLVTGSLAVFVIWVFARVFQFLQPVLVPIAFAGILAYLLEPLVNRLMKRGVPHFRAMMWVWLGFHAVMVLLLLSVAVPTITEASRFLENRGKWTESVANFVSDTVSSLDSVMERLAGGPAQAAAESVADQGSAAPAPAPAPAAPAAPSTAAQSPPAAPEGSAAIPTPLAQPAAPPGEATAAAPPKSASAPAAVPVEGRHRLRIRDHVRKWAQENSEQIAQRVTGFISSGFQGVLGIFGYLVGFLLVPLYLYYFLKESAAIKKNWSDYIPLRASRFKAELVDVLNEINGYLIAFFRGQMLVSLIDGIFVGLCLALIGLPYAMIIGIFVFLLGLIPYVGNIICWGAAVLISMAHFSATNAAGELVNTWQGVPQIWAYPLIVSAIFIIVQQVNSLVTAPRIVGDAVGLHPLTVIFSVLFWSLLIGGMLGALLAVPLTAAVKVLFRRYIWERKVQPHLGQPGDYMMS